jgi:hypothetical protein
LLLVLSEQLVDPLVCDDAGIGFRTEQST